MKLAPHLIAELAARRASRVAAFRSFVEISVPISSVRLVHYAGANAPNARDVFLSEAAAEIEGCLAEGFYVDWALREDRLFLLVQEPDGPIPPWSKVFSEEALIDVDEILRDARARGDLRD